MTIIIDGTVGANKAVVLDSAGKLPAIDGSLVTTLNATQVTTGSIATARLDTGTTDGKVLVLDGSGNMPAISASNMTGVESATKSASNPTLTTNPSGGVGTKWINTTTGNIYICTDATTDANVWKNSGATSGGVAPWAFTDGGAISVYTMGGWTGGSTNKIEKISVTADANSTDISNLTAASAGWGGCSSQTHGYTCGGGAGMGSGTVHNRIEKFQFSSDGDASDIADMTVSKYNRSGHSSTTHGYSAGGQSGGSPTSVDVIDRFPFASDSDATDVGNLLSIRCLIASSSDTDYGYCAGGEANAADTNLIQRFQFAASANSYDVGDLTNSIATPAGHSGGTTHGFVSGGNTNVIQRYAYASSGNATDWADLTWSVHHGQGSESTTYGYAMGGYPISNVVQKFPFASQTNATDVGDLSETKAATSTAHN